MDSYKALVTLLAEILRAYHEKQTNEYPAAIGGEIGTDRGDDDRPAQLAQ